MFDKPTKFEYGSGKRQREEGLRYPSKKAPFEGALGSTLVS